MFSWVMRFLRWLLSLFLRRKRIDSPTAGLAPGGGGHQRPRDPHRRDPLSGVRQPTARRPSGNSAAVAVEEPDDDEAMTLVGATK